MIRYLYAREVQPPAPFVHVTLRSGGVARESGELPAQLDTAASRTVVPAHVVEELGLVALDEIQVEGVAGLVASMPTYAVQIEIRGLRARLNVEVAAHENEPFVILGRDVLNQFRVFLYGPELALEIG
jgi:predicted aspartyl protease